MAAYIGNIGEYREWLQYAVRLNHFLSANSMEDDQKKDVFFIVITPQTYKLLKSLVAPDKPGEKDYTQALTQYFDPAPLEIVQRYRFNMRN